MLKVADGVHHENFLPIHLGFHQGQARRVGCAEPQDSPTN